MAVRSPREWTSEGRTNPYEREVVPDGSGRYTAERMTVREERLLP
jgi:hypothetical protein